ncbi:hypothetical protein [Argonema antarcticum]|uniref:hypothetical protein n=1 Tax=Argonema antarcticum TaxID=2942763 RepID=UPI0020131CF5|nr:hypothetical protein [Argonema antarcticum]MCL1476002.1 hypothetical protein [Argonema antarcticum A004/B2]
MNQTLVLQEFAIVIAAKNHNLTILNPDFLKYSGIVPTDWELARPPVYTNRVAQVTFANGISIIAEPNRVIFLEAIAEKTTAELATPNIARKYIQTLPNIEYQGIGLNPRDYISFESQQLSARKYLTETLFSPSFWHEEGTAPVGVTVNFTYTLERSSLNLSVNEVSMRFEDRKTVPVILFSGNFSYDIPTETGEERLKSFYRVLDNWQADLEIYKNIVNTKFLAKATEKAADVPEEVPIIAS